MDARDREAMMGKWYDRFDERRMVFELEWENEEGDPIELELPARYEVCDLCQGKGSHTNPSIDSNGLTREDFDEDPDFREDYLSGMYDVPCYRCGGSRVKPVLNEEMATEEQKKIMTEIFQSRSEEYWQREQEMKYGF